MPGEKYFRFMDPSQQWYEQVLSRFLSKARALVTQLLEEAEEDPNGCLVTPTKTPRKVRAFGGQDRAYRFVYCVVNKIALTREQVVRHLCHNRRCINPRHLVVGTKAENLQDERDRKANGIAFELL